MLKLAAFFLTGTKGKIPFFGELPSFVCEVVGPKLDEALYDTPFVFKLPRLK